jgi:uncharacterized protein (TIGR00304 family)
MLVGQKHLSSFRASPSLFDFTTAGFLLVLGGLVVVALALLVSSRRFGGEVKGAAVVLIGPIPIAFGSDAKWTSIAMILAIVLVVLSLLLFRV